MDYTFEPVGVIHTPYKEKFAIPRQPGLASAAQAHISLLGPCNREEIVRGLEGFSHLWLVFVFHDVFSSGPYQWKPMVRPPRLGGNQKVGVFASRSPFRPNPIGLSVVTLEDIRHQAGQWQIHVGGADLLDQTPILDIKPYVPYADAHPMATGNYAEEPPPTLTEITFSHDAEVAVKHWENTYPDLRVLITQVVSQQPQPAYHKDTGRTYGMRLYDLNIQWRQQDKQLQVIAIEEHSTKA